MKIVYSQNWFLDYRIPVFKHLKVLTNNNFYVCYNKDILPDRIHIKMKEVLGDRAIPFTNEKVIRIGSKRKSGDFANKYFEIKYMPGLYSKIKELKPDVLIGEGFFRWGLTNLIYRLLNKTKYIMLYERTNHTERNLKKIIKFLRKLTFPLIDGINCNGQLCKDYIMSLNYDETKITSNHMVADIDSIQQKCNLFTPKQREELKLKLGIQGKVFLYCGQIVERKGIKELLNAWTQLNCNETLILIGNGDKENFAKEIANKTKNVKYIRKVDFDSIHKYYSISDIFVILTLEDNGSIVVPEAMAAGLPVLTSKYNGNYPEYITPKNGWVVDPKNINEVIEVFKLAIKSDNLYEMGKESLRIVKNHTPEIAALNIFNASRYVS
jgi:glycosyltransferase involved in cell wall biosynthesis